MRTVATALLAMSAVLAGAQVWEKTIAPGLTYRMEIQNDVPRVIHALRYSPQSPSVKALPELADGVVFSDTDSKGRQTVSAMVAQKGALAGINGDFFPYTGDPLGLMVRAGELISVPVQTRAAFGWGVKNAGASIAKYSLTVRPEGGEAFPIDGLNQECGLNNVVLNTATAGAAIAKVPNTVALIKIGDARWSPNGEVVGEVESFVSDSLTLPVPKGYAVLVGHGRRAQQVASLRTGSKVRFRFQTNGFDWNAIPNVIGGGPFLLQEGQISVDWEAQGFKPEFATKRHPRSAVGRTASGDIWFAAVDGRQRISVGATLEEMAGVMKRLGCVEAINLDGGGSTSLNVLGLLINRPNEDNQPGERKVANGILFYGELPPVSQSTLLVKAPDKLTVGVPITLEIVDAEGNSVPHSEVLWSSSGTGLIDQGGLVRPYTPGTVNVAAYVRGQLVGTSIPIVAAPVVPPPAKKETAKSPSRKGTRAGRGG